MGVLVLLLYLLALVCFFVAAFSFPTGRVNLVALGLGLTLLGFLIHSRAFDNLN